MVLGAKRDCRTGFRIYSWIDTFQNRGCRASGTACGCDEKGDW